MCLLDVATIFLSVFAVVIIVQTVITLIALMFPEIDKFDEKKKLVKIKGRRVISAI